MPTVSEDSDLPRFVLDKKAPVTTQVHAHLRHLILQLHLKPGEAISEKDLSVKLGLSRTPVREAFIRLAQDGLVDIFPQRGTFVAPIRMSEVTEAHFIRRVLELAVVRRAAETPDPATLARIEESLRQQAAAQQVQDFNSFMDLDEGFHRLLSEGVALPRAWKVIQGVKGQLDRLRYFILPEAGHSELIEQEHRAIYEAIKAGDPARAAAEMRVHLAGIWAFIEQLMHEHPAFFHA